jgi:hypothetical protein
MNRVLIAVAVLLLHTGLDPLSRAQAPAEAVAAEAPLLSDAELDFLLGPIALYPDPLLAVLLPAATQPGEIVRAVRYLDYGGDVEQMEMQPWSDSIKSLAHYPDVLRWMNENLQWTAQLGEAYLNQPEDVMATIQRLRAIAQSFGNLISTPQQTVEKEDGMIDIVPVDPDVVYVPVYQPDLVYTRPAAYGVGPLVSFGPRLSVGTWLRNDWDWRNRRVVIWSKENFRPRTFWSQPRAERFRETTHFQEWCPRQRGTKAPSKWWAARRQHIEAGRTGKPTSTHSPSASAGGNKTARTSSPTPQVSKPLPAVIH